MKAAAPNDGKPIKITISYQMMLAAILSRNDMIASTYNIAVRGGAPQESFSSQNLCEKQYV